MKDKPKSPDSTSFPVRITKSDHQWLVGMAQEHGVEISVIIRWAVTAFRRYIELHDGKLHLPIDLNVTWKSMTANQEAAAIFEKSFNRAAESSSDDPPIQHNPPQPTKYFPPKKKGSAS